MAPEGQKPDPRFFDESKTGPFTSDEVRDVRLARQAAASPDPMQLFASAIEKGFNGDQLGQLLALQREWKKDQAAEEFARAVTGFQHDMPAITRSRTASVKMKSGGEFQYRYASFDNILKIARPYLDKWGIAVTFDSESLADGRAMKITCNIRVGIHTEARTLTLPVAGGVMNDAQAAGSALSYGKRYSLCAALNIVVTDEDDDASALDRITETEAGEMRRIIEKIGKPVSSFLKFAGVEPAQAGRPCWDDLLQMPNTELARVMDELNRRERDFDNPKKKPDES
jgi:hypothetical protein